MSNKNNQTHPKAGTQGEIVLNMLIAANGNEVEGFILAAHSHSLAVHSVVSKLRTRYGWTNIINRREYHKIEGRKICHSFYSLPTGQAEKLAS